MHFQIRHSRDIQNASLNWHPLPDNSTKYECGTKRKNTHFKVPPDTLNSLLVIKTPLKTPALIRRPIVKKRLMLLTALYTTKIAPRTSTDIRRERRKRGRKIKDARTKSNKTKAKTTTRGRRTREREETMPPPATLTMPVRLSFIVQERGKKCRRGNGMNEWTNECKRARVGYDMCSAVVVRARGFTRNRALSAARASVCVHWYGSLYCAGLFRADWAEWIARYCRSGLFCPSV